MVCVALLLELKHSGEAEEALWRTSDPKLTGLRWTSTDAVTEN